MLSPFTTLFRKPLEASRTPVAVCGAAGVRHYRIDMAACANPVSSAYNQGELRPEPCCCVNCVEPRSAFHVQCSCAPNPAAGADSLGKPPRCHRQQHLQVMGSGLRRRGTCMSRGCKVACKTTSCRTAAGCPRIAPSAPHTAAHSPNPPNMHMNPRRPSLRADSDSPGGRCKLRKCHPRAVQTAGADFPSPCPCMSCLMHARCSLRASEVVEVCLRARAKQHLDHPCHNTSIVQCSCIWMEPAARCATAAKLTAKTEHCPQLHSQFQGVYQKQLSRCQA